MTQFRLRDSHDDWRDLNGEFAPRSAFPMRLYVTDYTTPIIDKEFWEMVAKVFRQQGDRLMVEKWHIVESGRRSLGTVVDGQPNLISLAP